MLEERSAVVEDEVDTSQLLPPLEEYTRQSSEHDRIFPLEASLVTSSKRGLSTRSGQLQLPLLSQIRRDIVKFHLHQPVVSGA